MRIFLSALAAFLVLSTAAFAREPAANDISNAPAVHGEAGVPANEDEEYPAAPTAGVSRSAYRSGGTFLYLMVEDMFPNVGSLNDQLSGAGYPKLLTNVAGVGLGGHMLFDPWVVAVELQSIVQQKQAGAAYTSTLNGGYFLVNVGYTVYSKNTLRIYPLAGVGYGTLTAGVTGNSPLTFSQVLANPRQESSISTSSVMLNIGLAADGITLLSEKNGESVFVFGFRMGYLYAAQPSDWRNASGVISGGPTAGFTGPYLQIIIGGGLLG